VVVEPDPPDVILGSQLLGLGPVARQHLRCIDSVEINGLLQIRYGAAFN
jgi:hypothetical protein